MFVAPLSTLLSVLFLCSVMTVALSQELCTLASAGGTEYSLSYLGTVQSQKGGPLGIWDLPIGYTNAYINFCEPVSQCGDSAYACITGSGVQTITLCPDPPTGEFINSAFPQLGAKWTCQPGSGAPLNALVSSVT